MAWFADKSQLYTTSLTVNLVQLRMRLRIDARALAESRSSQEHAYSTLAEAVCELTALPKVQLELADTARALAQARLELADLAATQRELAESKRKVALAESILATWPNWESESCIPGRMPPHPCKNV